MVVDKVFLLSVVCLTVASCLPALRESPDINRKIRSAVPQYPILGRLSQDGDPPSLGHWELKPPMGEEEEEEEEEAEEDIGEDIYPPINYVISRRPDTRRPPADYEVDDLGRRSRPVGRLHHPSHSGGHQRRATTFVDIPVVKKRSEETNIPTMGLGVLSDMRKFFTDLRVNLDSVEEAAALSQEQANFRNGNVDPSDFLAFLARHGARSSEATSRESQGPRNIRRLMFGYNHDDQPYIHTSLGK